MNDLVGLVSNHQQEFTPLIKLFIVMTFMMFLPTIIFMMTSFVRIIITFSFLKSALGAQQSIPNQILVGIALVLTIFIMSPVVDKINKEAIQPYREEKITFQEGIEKAQIPMKEFLLKQTRDEDINLFLDSARIDKNDVTRENLPLQVLVPAFAISELKTAFQIGFLIYLPFLLIDLVVSSALMSMDVYATTSYDFSAF